MLWIDRLENRVSAWFDRLPYLNVIAMIGVLLIVAELLAVGWIARGQVERSNQQQASVTALRTRMLQCADSGPGSVADRCRAQVLASAGNLAGNMLVARASRLPNWDDRDLYDRNEHRELSGDVQVAGGMARSGIVPVAMVQTLR